MDPILYWNDVALEANRTDFSGPAPEQGGPTLSARALAIVHLAMYDAFVGAAHPGIIAPDHYLPPPVAAPAGASVDGAVAAAAHATLSALFPRQRMFFDLRHSQAGLTGPGLTSGHEFGRGVALRLLDARKNDPGAGDDGYVPSLARGRHRPDPDNPDQPFHAPFYGANSTCFAASAPARHLLDPPPAVSTAAGSDYVRALQQVRGKGIAPELMATVAPASRRTVDETLIGLYWAYDGAVGLGTPPRFYNQILRIVALTKDNPGTGAPNTPAQNARLFALVNAAMGDAGILAWEQKYRPDFDYWRPVVGIREHDPSMGPLGTAANNIRNDSDPLWLPLGAPSTNADTTVELPSGYPTGHSAHRVVKNFTPPFPSYPSGHATFGSAAFHIARLFYGVAPGTTGPDTLCDGLAFVSDELNGINRDNQGTVRPRHARSFEDGGLMQMIVENGRSRVFLGVHWLFDAFVEDGGGAPDFAQNIGGVPLGLAIAEDIFAAGMHAADGAAPLP